MRPEISKYIKDGEANIEFVVCTDVLKLESLHFGYWEEGVEPTFSQLGPAQERYTQQLIGHIPESVEHVLDVGCGIGDVSRALNRAGYSVTALSPDTNHARHFEGASANGTNFHETKFEHLDLDRTFDLILMSESQNYFDPEVGFRQCRRYLEDGGFLLVCGMFRRTPDRDGAFGFMRNDEQDYLEMADQHGLTLLMREDITQPTLPTLQLAQHFFTNHFMPALDLAALYSKKASPLARGLLRWMLRRERQKLNVIHEYYSEFADPALFAANVRYLTLLFRKD